MPRRRGIVLVAALLLFALLPLSSPDASAQQASPASPSPEASETVAPSLPASFWGVVAKDVGIPLAGGIVSGIGGHYFMKWLLTTGARETIKKWLPAWAARSVGTALIAATGVFLTNFIMDQVREAMVQRALRERTRRGRQNPGPPVEPSPVPSAIPGFEDLRIDEEFPR